MSKVDPDSYIYVLDDPKMITLKIKSATSASNDFLKEFILRIMILFLK